MSTQSTFLETKLPLILRVDSRARNINVSSPGGWTEIRKIRGKENSRGNSRVNAALDSRRRGEEDGGFALRENKVHGRFKTSIL